MFRGLERHETYPDDPGLPHVLIVEAAKGDRDPARLERFERLLRERFLDHREEWELSRLRIEKEQLEAKLSERDHELAVRSHVISERDREIAWMRQSRFWRLRDAWWRLRRRIGLDR
jgi:hypothetical protein